MAGFKASQLADNPVAYWTFDFDRQGLNGNLIIDEIGNVNPMVVNSDTAGDNYWLEIQSLNDIEVADQYAMQVARDQKINGVWREQFFEVVHTSSFNFPDKGEFSVEWIMNKAPADVMRQSGQPAQYSDVHTPLFRKGSTFEATIVDSRNYEDYLNIKVLGRSISCGENTYPIWNRDLHCVVTYTVTQTDVNEYQSVVTFYVNGRIIGTNTATHVDTFPQTATSASWMICGNGGSDPKYDFATESLIMDQIAVYSYGLTPEAVANHYRKTKQYDRMILDDLPQRYWRLDEEHDPLNTTITADAGGITGKYYGGVNRYQLGPDRIVNSRSAFFQKGSSGYIDHSDNNNDFLVILHPNQDYTLEFWFKTDDDDRGVLFDCTEELPPNWDGIRVLMNSKDNAHAQGSIQVAENHNNYLSSLDLDGNGDKYLFNDNEWHHLAMRRSGNTLQLYLDGYLHAENEFAKVSVGKPAQVHLMNTRFGDYSIRGHLAEVAFYTRALQSQQIYNRYIFSTRYKVAGYTLLQGAPVQALLRFYDTITGAYIDEVLSDPNTGEYVFHPMSNRHLDVVSKLPDSSTTRYRIHGPVAPAEYDDSHLQ